MRFIGCCTCTVFTEMFTQRDRCLKFRPEICLQVIIPDEADRKIIHDVIFNKLVAGRFTDKSRDRFLEVIETMISRGAEGVILGCTEIPLLIEQEHVNVPVFNTTRIHAEGAVMEALRAG